MKTVKEIEQEFIDALFKKADDTPMDYRELVELLGEYHRQMSWRDEYDKAMDE